MDFKFVSHGLWSEKQNILPQQMHKKEFWIFANNASFSYLRLFPHLLVKIQNSFYACVEEGCFASLKIARDKQT